MGGTEGPNCPEAAVPSEVTGLGLGAHILALMSSDFEKCKTGLGQFLIYTKEFQKEDQRIQA